MLLALAGRLDDDALSSVRELVAVEDDAAAAELLGGSLLAAEVGLTARELAVLDGWFAAARVDPELVEALPRDPEADRRLEHRFVTDPPVGAAVGTDGPGEVIARAASRLPGVRHVRQCWRTTPAGSSPGPVPHRVVLVETHSADDCEHVAHHVAHAARELGAVSVEVFATDAELPPYHRAAVAAARALGTAAPAEPVAGARPPAPTAPPAGPAASGSLPVLPARRRPSPSGPADAAPAAVPPFGVAPGAAGSLFAGHSDVPPREHGAEDEFRIVADSGHDRTADPESDVDPDEGFVLEDRTAAESAPEPEPEPDLVDLDPATTAERIAALWRRPVDEDVTADETDGSAALPVAAPVREPDDGPRYRPAVPEYGAVPSTADPYAADPYAVDPHAVEPYAVDPYAAAAPFAVEPYAVDPSAPGPSAPGPSAREPYASDPYPASFVESFVAPYGESDLGAPPAGPGPRGTGLLPGDVDPSAATGDLSLADLGAERAGGTAGHHRGDGSPLGDAGESSHDGPEGDQGRVLRARHSRGAGSEGTPAVDGPGVDPLGGPPPEPEPPRSAPTWPEPPVAPATPGTNGHRHAPDGGPSADPATEPVTQPAEPAPVRPPPPARPRGADRAEGVRHRRARRGRARRAGAPGRGVARGHRRLAALRARARAARAPARGAGVTRATRGGRPGPPARTARPRRRPRLRSRRTGSGVRPGPGPGRAPGPGAPGPRAGPPPPPGVDGYRPGPGTPPAGPTDGRANGHGLPPGPDPYPEDG